MSRRRKASLQDDIAYEIELLQARESGQAKVIWALSGVAGVLFGVIVGYVVAAETSGRGVAAAAAVVAADAPPGHGVFVDERELQSFRDILAADPKNIKAATRLGDLLYDAGRHAEAIPYYQQAFELDRTNVNVSTDLGTSLWYSGRADEALAQYARSLEVNATHPQTLFNIGIVKLDGKNDPAGAIEAWERLLDAHPAYPEAASLRDRIAAARERIPPGSASASSTR